MRARLRMVCIGAFSLAATAGCTLKNVNVPPAELMRQVQAGQPMLDCRAECSGAWGQNRQQVRILDATGRWQDLALLVAQIGYMNDLSYYYLGHAAENLGYWQAAQRYYRIAERLSVGPMSCHQGEVEILTTLSIPADLCDGYFFPGCALSASPDRRGAPRRTLLPDCGFRSAANKAGRPAASSAGLDVTCCAAAGPGCDTGIRSWFKPCPEFWFCRARPGGGIGWDPFLEPLRRSAAEPVRKPKRMLLACLNRIKIIDLARNMCYRTAWADRVVPQG